MAALKEHGLTLEKIWITHGHLDHAGGTAALKALTGAPIEGPHPDDQFWIDDIGTSAAKWGMPEAQPFTPDRWLKDGDKATARIEVGIKVLGDGGKVIAAKVFTDAEPIATFDAATTAAALNTAFGKVASAIVPFAIAALDQEGDAAGPAPASARSAGRCG